LRVNVQLGNCLDVKGRIMRMRLIVRAVALLAALAGVLSVTGCKIFST
jgi:hypothetical protein